jgi:hypothetical protein
MARRKIEHHSFLIVYGPTKFKPIEQQKHFHRGVGHALVAIDEGMIQCQRKPQSRRPKSRIPAAPPV